MDASERPAPIREKVKKASSSSASLRQEYLGIGIESLTQQVLWSSVRQADSMFSYQCLQKNQHVAYEGDFGGVRTGISLRWVIREHVCTIKARHLVAVFWRQSQYLFLEVD